MPTISTHLPDSSPYVEKLNARAPDDARGARSKYLRELVERDLDNQPADVNALRPDVMEFLTHELCGKPDMLRMRQAVNGRDQVQELKRLLLRYMADEEKRDEVPFAAEEPAPITAETVAELTRKLDELLARAGGRKAGSSAENAEPGSKRSDSHPTSKRSR